MNHAAPSLGEDWPMRHDLAEAADCPLQALAWAMDPQPPGALRHLLDRIARLLLGDGESAPDGWPVALSTLSSGYPLLWWDSQAPPARRHGETVS